MDTKRHFIELLVLAFCLFLISLFKTINAQPAIFWQTGNQDQPAQSNQQDKPQNEPASASQDQGTQSQASQEQGPQGATSSDQPPADTSNGSQTGNSDATKGAPTDDQASKSPKPAAKDPNAPKPPRTQMYGLTDAYSVELSPEWRTGGSGEIPPPAILSPYAPPFHLSGNLVFSDTTHGAILQFATSDDPFIGHDAYWLDTQIHSPSGSGMSLLDFFFYYFFPPSDACIHQVLTTYANADRAPPTGDTPPYMQVYYACPVSDTLSGYYAAQVSSGITFQLTNDGTRVLAPVGNFYVAPMEETDSGTMTFFIFEAQSTDAVSSESAERFHLPPNAQGGQPDFFWAIGSTSPFPFVADSGRKDTVLLHVAYARIGAGPDAKAEFMEILHNIRTH
jgi:hypothetical protein